MKAHAVRVAGTIGMLATLALLLGLGPVSNASATERVVLGEMWSADG